MGSAEGQGQRAGACALVPEAPCFFRHASLVPSVRVFLPKANPCVLLLGESQTL